MDSVQRYGCVETIWYILEQECESAIQYEMVSTHFPWIQRMYGFLSTPYDEALIRSQSVLYSTRRLVLEKRLLTFRIFGPELTTSQYWRSDLLVFCVCNTLISMPV